MSAVRIHPTFKCLKVAMKWLLGRRLRKVVSCRNVFEAAVRDVRLAERLLLNRPVRTTMNQVLTMTRMAAAPVSPPKMKLNPDAVVSGVCLKPSFTLRKI